MAGACEISMLKKVRDLLAPKKPLPVREFNLDEVLTIIEEEERSWREDLERRMAPPRQKFNEVSSALLVHVTTLIESERDSLYHPKIEKITRNSLPQFAKAVTVSLGRPAPPDPLAFYQVATEILRGCVKALAGPGRYLGTAFPDQMRDIRVLVDELGHQVNEMTPLIAEDKKRGRIIAQARDALTSIRENQAALVRARESMALQETRERELARKSEELLREKEDCDREVQVDRALHDAIRERDAFSDRVTETEREIHAMTSTLVHVFKKGEKILQRRGGAERELKKVIDLMASEGNDLGEETVERISRVIPLVTSMIETGEIQLKNQEEIALFSSPDSICTSLLSLVQRRKEAGRELREKDALILSHPAKNRSRQVEKALDDIASDREKVRSEIRGFEAEIKVMEKEIPKKIHDLEGALRELLAGEVRLKV